MQPTAEAVGRAPSTVKPQRGERGFRTLAPNRRRSA
jgi:hypothetical protein